MLPRASMRSELRAADRRPEHGRQARWQAPNSAPPASAIAVVALLIALVCLTTASSGGQRDAGTYAGQAHVSHGQYAPNLAGAQLDPVTTNVGPAGPQRAPLSSTVFTLDSSGSMRSEWPGGVKIDSARQALTTVSRLIRHDIEAHQLRHHAGLVTFATSAQMMLGLTDDLGRLDRLVAAVSPDGSTNIGAGLELSVGEALRADSQQQRLVVLLSDGMANEGMNRDEILAGPVAQAASEHIPIYVCGYGTRGGDENTGIDEEFLKEIASATGGSYYYATSGVDLENIYIRIRHESVGRIIADLIGFVSQGETKQAGTIIIPPGTEESHTTGNWPGSWLDFALYDPRGRRVDASYPGATIFAQERPFYTIIRSPIPGQWRVEVFGRDVPEGTLQYQVIASARGAPEGGGGGGAGIIPPTSGQTQAPPARRLDWTVVVLIALLVATALVAAGFVWVLALRHPARGAEAPRIVVASGSRRGLVLRMERGIAVIGADPECDLVLDDPEVSGRHATICLRGDVWELTDLKSTNGSFVNGQRVDETYLRDGDLIRLGSTLLRFCEPT